MRIIKIPFSTPVNNNNFWRHIQARFSLNFAFKLSVCFQIDCCLRVQPLLLLDWKRKETLVINLELMSQYKEDRLVNLSMGALGVFSNFSTSFLDMMNDLYFDESTRKFIIRRLMTIFIQTTYYIFCPRNKDGIQNC